VFWTFVLIAFSLQWFGPAWAQADTYDQTVIAQSLAMAVIFLSFVVLTGMTGQVSLMQAAFVTAGGFAAGWGLTHHWGVDIPLIFSHGQLNFFWAIVIGGVAAAALGAVLALPLSRLGGVNFALGTLAWAFFLSLVPWSIDSIRNGESGWTIRSPTLSIPGLNWLNDFFVHQLNSTTSVSHLSKMDFSLLPEQILMFLAIFGVLTLTVHALMRSSSGRAILAMRSSEVAAEASGIAVNTAKVKVFALSAGIAGIGGVLLGMFSFQVTNNTAPPIVGMLWLALAVTFGIRRPGGALLAGFAFAAGTAVFHWISSDLLTGGDINALITSVYFVPILSGLGAIQLAQEPDGILSYAGNRKLEKRHAAEIEKRRKAQIAAAEAVAHDGLVPEHERDHATVEPVEQPVGSNGERTAVAAVREPGPADSDGERAATAPTLATDGHSAFEIRGVVAGYRDVEVLHGVDLALEPGTITALLGPNGAGKSTTCSVAAGLVEPSLGRVYFRGDDITELSPFRRARAGILLVPEARGIFPGLSVEENLVLQVRDAELRQKAYDRFPILYERRGQPAGLLSGGEQQMLSLAPALAAPPAVLIADEPTLGLAPLAAETVIEAVVELRDRGCAVLLVEEHARNALEIADTLVFMQLGNIAWSGPRADADMDSLAGVYFGNEG
jgi:ABC-type branched-subunit amino acid transport system ATPase component/ABC-type branched-subunit amino acid transport system permease subunit